MARQRSSDLFPTDQPIPASQMIGRAVDVREIASTLAGGSSVVLAGARRTGKTSVCDAVLGRLGRRGFYTVAVDLFRIATTAELAEALVSGDASPIARHCGARCTRRGEPGGSSPTRLQTSAVLKSKAQLGEELEIAFSPGLAARDPERYLDYALALPARIAAADRKEVIVFFDEFQEIASPQQPYGDARSPDQAHARDIPALGRRQLPVRREPRASDARPVHALPSRAAPVRWVLRPAPDRPRHLDGGSGRALRGRRVRARAERPDAYRRVRRAAPPHNDADRPEELTWPRSNSTPGRWTQRSSSRVC